MGRLLALGAFVVGGVIAARRFLPSEGHGPDRRPGTMRQRLMARMIEGMPPDSPPRLVMSILPRLQQQNDQIIALLREQNELLRRARPETKDAEKERFFLLVSRLTESSDPAERDRLKEQLARMTFGS